MTPRDRDTPGPGRQAHSGSGDDATASIVVTPLEPADIPIAYPLIQLVAPEVSPERWRTFALSVLRAPDAADGRRGLLGARSRRGDLLGCCSYALHPDLRHGSVMEASHLVAFDIAGRAAVVRAILETLHDMARGCGCPRLRIQHPGSNDVVGLAAGSIISSLRSVGLEPEAVCFGKAVAE